MSLNKRPQGIVEAWHEALNARDAERLLELSHPEVSVGGPRGGGTDLLLACAQRANVTPEPLSNVDGDDTVLVGETAPWTSSNTDEPDSQATVTSFFTVSEDVVASVDRPDDRARALGSVGFDDSLTSGTL
jgi:hypothetical protein